MRRVNILGVEISAVNKETAIQYLLKNMDKARGRYICACNVHTTVTAHENLDYQAVQNNSFMTLPDGKPLSSVGIRRGYSEMGRVTGPDFMEQVIAATEKSDARHYFYGTTQENLNALLEYLKVNYPQLSIVGCEPSLFRPLTIQEETELCDRINESKADFVWVALGAPRQEKFCAKLSKNTNAVWIAVGGAFNVISGVIPRAPQWMQDHSLEWLYRWSKEPKRLFKRYAETNSKFIFYLIKEKVEKDEKKVCMVVPSFTAKGGITAVVNGYQNSQLTEDYDVRFIETYCDGNKIKKVAIYLKSMFKYLYALIFWRAEIIHIHSSFGGSFYRKKFFIDFGRLFNCKIVNHIHGSYYDEFYFKASNYKKKMVQKTYEKCNIFIVLNESAEKNLKQIVPDKQVVVIENYGILETSAIHNYKNRNENVVLFLGFVTEKKGCFDMPRISEIVLQEVPDAQFVLGGVGELEKLEKLVNMNHFKFLGWIEGEEKKEWLERAKVFFLPSYSEAMPMSILEAMGYGLPVVASNVGGIPSIVRNNINGFTFIPGDVEGMAAAIIEILKNSKLANKLSENSAKIIAEEYSLKSHIDAVEKLYEVQA